jgi:hypothetical protein
MKPKTSFLDSGQTTARGTGEVTDETAEIGKRGCALSGD